MMAHQCGVDGMPGIETLFEGKQHQHTIDTAANVAHPVLTPCPYRRAHVVHGRDPAPAKHRLEPEIEIRGINSDEHVRLAGDEAPGKLSALGKELQISASHFHQAHHRQTLHGKHAATALFLHSRSGNAFKACLRHPFADGRNQPGAQDVAGRLARTDHDSHIRPLSE